MYILQICREYFTCLILIFIEWFVNFFIIGLDFSRVQAFSPNQTQVLGTVVFNYAFVITVPSWVNEKKPDVSINKSIWTATSIATAFYVSIGLFGAWTFNFTGDQDLLDAIAENWAIAYLVQNMCLSVSCSGSIKQYSSVFYHHSI